MGHKRKSIWSYEAEDDLNTKTQDKYNSALHQTDEKQLESLRKTV